MLIADAAGVALVKHVEWQHGQMLAHDEGNSCGCDVKTCKNSKKKKAEYQLCLRFEHREWKCWNVF